MTASFLARATVALLSLPVFGAAKGHLAIIGPDTEDVGPYSSTNVPIVSFAVANTGKETLRFIRVVSTCRCLAVDSFPKTISPGGRGAIEIAVNTDEAKGPFNSTVMIETDSRETPFSHVVVKSAMPWNRQELYQVPRVFPCPEYATNGVKTLFYESVPFQGKPTRVFAYVGVPTVAPGKKISGIVLIHGGGGSAFYRWVKLWNDRGYAAISMDTCGCISGNVKGDEQRNHIRHAWGGPAGWGDFKNADAPVADQWTYHAVAATVRGHSLLRSLPGVDAERIGVTGISWGGYLTCIVAGVDDRFRFAIPVYGCGFLGENSCWNDNHFDGATKGQAAKWISLWDPMQYLPLAKMPFLWVDGSNDFAYPLDSVQKSYRSLQVPYLLCTRLRMPHGHGAAGENPAEILAFANQTVCGGPKLPSFLSVSRNGLVVTAKFSTGDFKIDHAVLNYTLDSGKWQKRLWQEAPSTLHGGELTATLPDKTEVYYLNLFTDNGLVISSEHEVCKWQKQN